MAQYIMALLLFFVHFCIVPLQSTNVTISGSASDATQREYLPFCLYITYKPTASWIFRVGFHSEFNFVNSSIIELQWQYHSQYLYSYDAAVVLCDYNVGVIVMLFADDPHLLAVPSTPIHQICPLSQISSN